MNTEASRSRVMDADYAKEATELARTQIIQQVATAMLAQANTETKQVLTLLEGVKLILIVLPRPQRADLKARHR